MTETDDGRHQYYRHHVFCCMNVRPDNNPRGDCSRKGARRLRNYMKARAKKMGLEDVRINESGCLDRCELGPTMVVYPEGIWYRATSKEEIDEILDSHLRDGQPVERLMLGLED